MKKLKIRVKLPKLNSISKTIVIVVATIFVSAGTVAGLAYKESMSVNKQNPENTASTSEITQTEKKTLDAKQNQSTNDQENPQDNNSYETTLPSDGRDAFTPTSNIPPTSSTTPKYQKPQCSSSLRASTVSYLKQAYQTQYNRSGIDLGAWYRLNYQKPTYTHQQYLNYKATLESQLAHFINVSIAQENDKLSKEYTCTPITKSELGIISELG